MRCLLIIALLPLYALAHPGIGIVQDSKGAIYYTDLEQVWKINRDGRTEVAVPQVHTHELYIDSHDNLYGEHLWYNGERANTWGHFVWRLSGNGVLDTLKGPSEGFLEGYSFVRDKKGNMYWAERSIVTRFKKKALNGTITTLGEVKLKNVSWLHATPHGLLYFLDQEDLYKIEPDGGISPIAKDITQRRAAFAGAGRAHALFGIWTDSDGNIYVANYSEQVVKRIQADGQIENAVHSKSPWAPTGGLFDAEGNLWLLEVSHTNDVQVRKIPVAELRMQEKASVRTSNYVWHTLVAMAILSLLFMILWNQRRKRRPQAA